MPPRTSISACTTQVKQFSKHRVARESQAMKKPDSKKLVLVTLRTAGGGEGHMHKAGGMHTYR